MTPGLTSLWQECKDASRRLPLTYTHAITDIWELCIAEIEGGESEENEITHARADLRRLEEGYNGTKRTG
jgi:hypothetical protein